MYLANYFVQGEVTHSGLPQWLVENTGLFGSTPEAMRLVLWINSEGGDVVAALEAINLIKASPVPVVTIINGSAESAALLIASAGHRRLMIENSWGMAHHFSTGAEGNYHDLMDTVKHHNILHNTMVRTLVAGSNLSTTEVEEKLLGRANVWLTAEEMLEYGLIDEIVPVGADLKSRILYNDKKRPSETSEEKKRPISKRSRRKSD